MKSRLLNVLMTLAILVGLLIPMASTAPVSAGDMSWTQIDTPAYNVGTLRPSSDVDFIAVAADGKTMFAYSNVSSAVVTAQAAIGATTITVDSTEGFPAAGVAGIVVGGAAMVQTAKTATTFTVPATAAIHYIGETVTSAEAAAIQGRLLKSIDGGVTWTGVNIGTGINGIQVSTMAISKDYAADTTIIAAGAVTDLVYRSIDGGQTFGPMPPVTGLVGGTDTILSIAVGPWYKGGQSLLAGWSDGAGTGGAALFTTLDLTWVDLTTIAGWGAAVTGGDVTAVAFSPQHKIDAEIIVVSTTAAAGTWVKTRFGTNAWDADVSVTGAQIVADTAGAINAAATLRGSMAFPADYDWSTNNRVLVGMGRAAATAGTDDLYRVQGALVGGQTRVYDLNASGATGTGTNVASVAFKGNIADGLCVIGQYNDRTVITTSNVNLSPITWVTSSKHPGLDAATPNVKVLASPTADAIFAGSTGTSSGLFISMDKGVSFDGLSLIDISAANRLRLTTGYNLTDANTMFLVIFDDADNTGTAPVSPAVAPFALAANPYSIADYYMMFKSTDAGKTWKMILWIRSVVAGGADRISSFAATRTFATDQTIYVWQANTRFWKSSNGGSSWTGYTAQDNITGFGIIDKDTYFTGHVNKIYKSGRFTEATLDGETAFVIRMLDANTLMVTSSGGDVLISTDDGVTFTRVGPADGMGGRIIAGPDPKYATNKIIYAAAGGPALPGIYRWVMGQSSTWELVLNTVIAANDLTAGTFDISPDGTMYVGSSTAGVGIVRQVNPSDTLGKINGMNTAAAPVESPFERMNNARVQGMAANASIVQMRRATGAGVNTIYAVTQDVSAAPSSTTGYFQKIVALADNMINPPEIVAPKAGAVVNPNFTMQWKAITSPVQVSYRFEVATDAQMAGQVALATNVSDGASFQPAANLFLQGNNYWWRVRVNSASPLASRYTPATQFSIKLGQTGLALTLVTPDPTKATEQPIRPIFSWTAVQGAESYELEVADNPFFANAQAKKPLMNTVWAWDKDLDYSTTYYWRVRAIAGKNASDWVQSVFTTIAEPKPTVAPTATVAPTQTVTPPPAPKFFDPQSGLYFNSEAELKAYQAAHPAQLPSGTPGYIWAIIIIGAVLVIAVIVLIIRTRRVA